MIQQLHFVLRPSLTKLGINVGLFILFSAIVSQHLAGLFMGLAMLAALLLLYFFHPSNPVQQLAHLDENTWVLEFKDQTKQHLSFKSAHTMGFCVFMLFSDENAKTQRICITKDQLDLSEWKKLLSFVELK